MNRRTNRMPEGVPILSPGRHRNPKQGACFMEFASFLAGERWSDHPACTNATLAALARDINDLLSDTSRSRLVSYIPRVVGLTTDDPDFGMSIALGAARAALPVASMERQRALSVALIAFDSNPGEATRNAFAQAPDIERWARTYLGSTRITPRATARTQEAIVHTATTGIALACVDDTDARLFALLRDTIEAAEAALRPTVTEPELAPVR